MQNQKAENQITFITEDGEETVFFIEEQTVLNGRTYLLVTEDNGLEETNAYILKDISAEDDVEAVYSMLTDKNEIAAVAGIFEELLEDVDISL